MPTFDVSEGYQFGKYLEEVSESAARRAALATAHRLVAEITTQLIPGEPRMPVDTGAYRAGWRAEKRDYGADVANSMPYAMIIERGARAENIKIGKAMITALKEWVIRKGLHLEKGPVRKGLGRAAKSAAVFVSDDRATSIAWAIAMSMKKKGIFNGGKGLRILERAMEKAPEFLQEEFEREIARGGG